MQKLDRQNWLTGVEVRWKKSSQWSSRSTGEENKNIYAEG